MWLYLIIFLIPVIAYLNDHREQNRSVLFLSIYLGFLAVFVGMSDMFGGYDRYIYGEVFDNIADVTSIKASYTDFGVFDYFAGEPAYIWINIIISWFTANRYIFIFIYTLVIYLLLFLSLRKFSTNYPFSLILFMGLWFYFSFTYLRQVLGATVAWLAVQFIAERKFWKFFVVWFIAWNIHKSAILFFPFYFIPVKKFDASTVKYVMLAALIVGLSPLPNALFNAYGDNSVVEQRNDYNSSGSLRIEYLMEAVFFLYFILKKYDNIPLTSFHIIMLNMALIFCAMLLFFIRSENGGRLSWYYMLGVIITMTDVACKGVDRKNISLIFIFVCLALYVRVYNTWQLYLNLYPYKTFLTDGVRKGDYSWEGYEYDHRYDGDKLYREPFRLEVNFKK